jgi:hypothetical protein
MEEKPWFAALLVLVGYRSVVVFSRFHYGLKNRIKRNRRLELAWKVRVLLVLIVTLIRIKMDRALDHLSGDLLVVVSWVTGTAGT